MEPRIAVPCPICGHPRRIIIRPGERHYAMTRPCVACNNRSASMKAKRRATQRHRKEQLAQAATGMDYDTAIVDLYCRHRKSLRETAAVIGVTPPVIGYDLHRLGVMMRPRGGANNVK